MSIDPIPPGPAPSPERTPRRKSLRYIFTTVLFLSFGCAGFLGYLFYAEGKKPPPPPEPVIPSKVVQIDVLNGCGAKGAAAKFTEFLRSSGFDVVEVKNYSSSHLGRTMVIDRVGNLAAAKKVAAALGVPESNVVQQLNPDYFVDVSVVIGGDFESLIPGKTR
jgi:hypothetical protein